MDQHTVVWIEYFSTWRGELQFFCHCSRRTFGRYHRKRTPL